MEIRRLGKSDTRENSLRHKFIKILSESPLKEVKFSGNIVSLTFFNHRISDHIIIKRETHVGEWSRRRKEIFIDKKNTIANRAKDIDGQLQAIEGKRKILAEQLDKKILEKYEHILPAKEGLALVSVHESSCRGCFMKIPHQVINEIKMYEGLITCETCSRILYLEEDVNG